MDYLKRGSSYADTSNMNVLGSHIAHENGTLDEKMKAWQEIIETMNN